MSADQNPALLGQEMSQQVALNYMHYMGGSNLPVCAMRTAPVNAEPGALR